MSPKVSMWLSLDLGRELSHGRTIYEAFRDRVVDGFSGGE